MNMDLQDTTFVIPVRIDPMERLENLLMSVESILRHFQTQIHLLEAVPYPNQIIPTLIKEPSVTYIHYRDKDPVFYKTRLLNHMTQQVKTPIISVWDADVLAEYSQIEEAVRQLRSGASDIAYPYNGDFLDTSDILRTHYWEHRDLPFFQRHRGKMNSLYTIKGGIGAVGGAFFAKTDKYIAAGMENEDFYGWGLEDGERHYRWLKFGYRIYRSDGCLFHLSHPRDHNGRFRSSFHREKAEHDMNEIVNYQKAELKRRFSL